MVEYDYVLGAVFCEEYGFDRVAIMNKDGINRFYVLYKMPGKDDPEGTKPIPIGTTRYKVNPDNL